MLNRGVSGARILADRMGANALARFDRDVLRHRHADTVILLMGINDIGWADSIFEPNVPAPSAEASYFSFPKEQKHQAVNK